MIEETPTDAVPRNARCLAPLPTGWLALTAAGLVVLPSGAPLAVDLPAEEPEDFVGHQRGPALHTSPDGRFAAVVTDHGRYGVVVDLVTGARVLELDREEDADHFTTRYPLAFADARTLVVGTSWNRLDAFALPEGRLLTAREVPEEHDLDYYHGALLPNPSGTHVLDDGWVWHPIGVPTVVDVRGWLGGDTFAAEHGRWLGTGNDDWNVPMAWLDDDTVAVREDHGVGVYRHGEPVAVLDVPAGPLWGRHGLLHVGAEGGLETWDGGTRTGVVEGFRPTAFAPLTGAFAEVAGGLLRTWSA
ncbi:hypothetical protein [Actinosynnema sp. NPDC020468]|uniref:hypothetical protein n=1 Tax=Actinosynnema sp. NPDC020468 TaxID=3154488 RepID=UPI003400FE07